MSRKLPNVIAIETNGHYASVLTEPEALLGYVGAKEKNIYTPATKIEVETVKDSEYVHLRFCYDNRYLARVGGGTDDVWLVACSDKPEEDKSKWSCTLFEPEFHSCPKDKLCLKHVQTGKYVRLNHPGSEYKKDFGRDCFYLGQSSFQLRYKDWVMLPKYVAFKGDNGRYLKCRSIDKFLEFSSNARDEATAFEVTTSSCGHLYIKSKGSGKYMCLTDSRSKWICADSTEMGNDIRTRFEAVRHDDKTISLRSHDGKFCKMYTEGKYKDCFAAMADNINPDSLLQVEELVLESEICELYYQMDKARIYDQKPIKLNEASPPLPVNISYKDVKKRSFKIILGANVGVCTRATVKATTGIPVIEDGKATISREDSAKASALPLEGKEENERIFTVPPMSSFKVKLVAVEGKIDVPFHYTLRSRLPGERSPVETTHTDGVFSGVNYHSFSFEEIP